MLRGTSLGTIYRRYSTLTVTGINISFSANEKFTRLPALANLSVPNRDNGGNFPSGWPRLFYQFNEDLMNDIWITTANSSPMVR